MIGGKQVVLVVAIGENGVIGRNGALPWRLKSELQHFSRMLHVTLVYLFEKHR